MRLRIALVVVLASALARDAAALTIDSASVALNPKKTDGFAVKGQLTGLTLAGVDAVELDFGSFSQTIPVTSFTQKSGKFSFKGPKGAPGLTTVTIDTVKGKFA